MNGKDQFMVILKFNYLEKIQQASAVDWTTGSGKNNNAPKPHEVISLIQQFVKCVGKDFPSVTTNCIHEL